MINRYISFSWGDHSPLDNHPHRAYILPQFILPCPENGQGVKPHKLLPAVQKAARANPTKEVIKMLDTKTISLVFSQVLMSLPMEKGVRKDGMQTIHWRG